MEHTNISPATRKPHQVGAVRFEINLIRTLQGQERGTKAGGLPRLPPLQLPSPLTLSLLSAPTQTRGTQLSAVLRPRTSILAPFHLHLLFYLLWPPLPSPSVTLTCGLTSLPFLPPWITGQEGNGHTFLD